MDNATVSKWYQFLDESVYSVFKLSERLLA